MSSLKYIISLLLKKINFMYIPLQSLTHLGDEGVLKSGKACNFYQALRHDACIFQLILK